MTHVTAGVHSLIVVSKAIALDSSAVVEQGLVALFDKSITSECPPSAYSCHLLARAVDAALLSLLATRASFSCLKEILTPAPLCRLAMEEVAFPEL